MSITASKAKGKIKSIAHKNNADPRVLMRIYMMERFLERISKSDYKENFIIKAGILVTSLVGISMRSTMDIDTTIKSLDLTKETILKVVKEIADISLDDSVTFDIKKAEEIMDEMEYTGIRIHMNAICDHMITPIKIDISTGDVITPRAIEYQYNLMIEDRAIPLFAYNLETVLSEKLQTILVRERANTRMRDFYDIYTLMDLYDINKNTFAMAFKATCIRRGTNHILGNEMSILKIIEEDDGLLNLWNRYKDKYSYAKGIEYDFIIKSLNLLISIL